MRKAFATWLMRRRAFPYLHGNIQRWAIHHYLMQFQSYREAF